MRSSIEAPPDSRRIVIAGIGVGSLGLELLKCFSLTKQFALFGTDISATAYGHSDPRFISTRTLKSTSPRDYCTELLDYAAEVDAGIIAPGAEGSHLAIVSHRDLFSRAGVDLMINNQRVIDLCSDKVACNAHLKQLGFTVAETLVPANEDEIARFSKLPCVVKPAVNSGGSNLVFLAEDVSEAAFFFTYLRSRGFVPAIQEYIDSQEEFTVGVLSSRNGNVLTSIALKRDLTPKLSRSTAYGSRVISSGWSQGWIEDFTDVCRQAERIASAVGSTWALNVQGRMKDGVLIPFEINPRHSGTSFLRALAGVNEPVIALSSLRDGFVAPKVKIKAGQYLRTLSEHVVPRSLK
jgi:carbamoyl-phosphate synthase large subunit